MVIQFVLDRRRHGVKKAAKTLRRKKQSEPLLEMSIKLRRPCGFELALHCAFESGANQSPSRGDAVPNFRWENRMLDSWMRRNEMNFVT